MPLIFVQRILPLLFRSAPFLLFLSASSTAFANEPLKAAIEKRESQKETDEVIHILGQRNQLNSNKLVENNTEYTEFTSSQAIKPTLAQWLAQVPGLSLNGQGGLLQSYSIRGFSKWRVLTQVDGVPIYTDRRAGNSASFLPASLLAGFDLQKGPSSTLYGNDAMGGSINLKTLAVGERFLSASIQNNDQHQELTAAYSNDHWLSAINYRKANNSQSADGSELNSSFEQLAMVNKGIGQFNGIDYTLTWTPSVGNNIGKSAITYPNTRMTSYPEELHSLLSIELTKSNEWYAKLYHHYQNWDTDIIRVGSRQNITEYQAHTIGGSLLTSSSILGGEARYGIDWINRQGVSIKETEFNLAGQQQFSTPLIDGQQHNTALFSDIHWQFEQLSMSAGVRYDYISQRQFIEQASSSDQILNGSLLVNYQLNHSTNLQAEIATGFRFPTLTELYFEGETPRGTTLGNPNLSPEKSNGVQVSLNYTPTADLRLNIASYYYQMDDYIERYSIDKNTRGYRNLNQADIYGVETSLHWQQTSAWSHQLSYQWQQGEDENNDTLSDLHAPTWLLSNNWQGDSLSVVSQLSYRAKKSDFSSQEQAASDYLNWSLRFTTSLTNDIDLSVFGENLLDRLTLTSADEDAAFVKGQSIGIKIIHRY